LERNHTTNTFKQHSPPDCFYNLKKLRKPNSEKEYEEAHGYVKIPDHTTKSAQHNKQQQMKQRDPL